MSKAKLVLVIALVLVVVTLPRFAACGNPTPAFPTKDISWIVPYGPGGGFDVLSRSYAKTMQKELRVAIVIKNMPGAAGRLAWNTLHKAKPDGYTIGAYNMPGGIVGQLIHETRYDFKRVSWVGSMKNDVYSVFVSKNSSFQSIEDFKKADKPIRLLTIGLGASDCIAGVVMAETIGFPYTFVTGYKSHPEMAAALLRGEGDAQIAALESNFVQQHLKVGDIRVLLIFAKERDPLAPEVLTPAEIGYPQLTGLGLYFACGGPPGIPDDILRILRTAFMKAGQDKENIQRLVKAGYSPTPIPGDELGKIVATTLFPAFEAQVEVFRKVMPKK